MTGTRSGRRTLLNFLQSEAYDFENEIHSTDDHICGLSICEVAFLGSQWPKFSRLMFFFGTKFSSNTSSHI
jgi:hypothetical protein